MGPGKRTKKSQAKDDDCATEKTEIAGALPTITEQTECNIGSAVL